MNTDRTAESTDIPPEIDDRYEGEWIAWDTITREVVAHDRELGPVVRAAKEVFDSGHPIYYHHILAADTIILGDCDPCTSPRLCDVAATDR